MTVAEGGWDVGGEDLAMTVRYSPPLLNGLSVLTSVLLSGSLHSAQGSDIIDPESSTADVTRTLLIQPHSLPSA